MAQRTLQQAFDQALRYQQSGQLRKAENLYRQILTHQPDHAGAMHYLGLAAHQQGNHDAAIDLILKAIALNPAVPEVYNSLGVALQAEGEYEQAINAFNHAISLRPNYANAHYNLANAQTDSGNLDAAIQSYRAAIQYNPNLRKARHNLGDALMKKGLPDQAIPAYRQVIAAGPPDALACSRLGNALKDNNQLDEAIAAYRQAVAIAPDMPETHCELGNCLRRQGLLDQAANSYRQAIHHRPEYAQAHFNLGLIQLVQGDLLAGWDGYEWRWKCDDFASARRQFAQPEWDGSPLSGGIVLLHAEQGFGDAIQFIRYLPMVLQRGAKVVAECRPELRRLLRTLSQTTPADFQLVARGEPLPAFDLHCPLLSLPRLFRTTLATVPNKVPYLQAAPDEVAKWKQILAEYPGGLKVGLVWAGHPGHKNDRQRSLALEALAPLGNVSGIRFFSLQKQEANAIPTEMPAALNLIRRTEQLTDFADTAGLIANLDLLIAVDTSVVHLAGALGKPVWMLLPFVPDWRWLLNRNDSPWYPTLRLFRQPTKGDWASVIHAVVSALKAEGSLQTSTSSVESRPVPPAH